MITIKCSSLASTIEFLNKIKVDTYPNDEVEGYHTDELGNDFINYIPADTPEYVTHNLEFRHTVLTLDFLPRELGVLCENGTMLFTDPDNNHYVFKPLVKGKLIQLSNLPRESWIGRGIFHPHTQMGHDPVWLRWDSGVVVDMDWYEPFEQWRATFATGMGTLNYAASNLWVMV